MLKGIVFDMDGVLFDTERLAVQAYIHAGHQKGYAITEAMVLRTLGLNTDNSRKVYESIFGADFDAVGVHQDATAYMLNAIEKNGLPVKHGLYELLNILKERGLPTAIATSTNRAKVDVYLEKSGLTHAFSAVITGDMVTRGKPEPDIYLKACEALGFNPPEVMAIEDSPAGVLSASRAGLKTVMVPDLLEPDAATKSLLFACVPSLQDIHALL